MPKPVIANQSLEPVIGFEPTTCSLRENCSTPELHWRNYFAKTAAENTVVNPELK